MRSNAIESNRRDLDTTGKKTPAVARLLIANAPADRLFDYEVPEAFAPAIAVGSRVKTVFNRRAAHGYVVELADRSDYQGKLARIAAIEEPSPLILPPLVALARWMAGYYLAPLGKCLETMLPAPVRTGSTQERKQLYVEALEEPPPPPGRGSPQPHKEVAANCRGAQGSEGLAASCGEVQGSDGLAANCGARLTARQQELLGNIKRVGGGWLGQVCREFSCSVATLKKMAELGVLAIEERQMRRDPLRRGKAMPSSPLPLNSAQAEALEAIVAALPRAVGGPPADPASQGSASGAARNDSAQALSTANGAAQAEAAAPGVAKAEAAAPGAAQAPKPLLLFGVTGSGKTEVYLQAIAAALERGLGAIVLVPEIALTPQTVQRFASRFGSGIAVLHSALSNGERFDEWQRIRKGEARVVVGPRSAVFAPVERLGLIVVDEEHEPSYKQEETPRYNARDLAVMRAHIEGCAIVLGSATPALESWRNTQIGKYRLFRLQKRAVEGSEMPHVNIIDMGEENAREGRAQVFSKELLAAIRERLDRSEQVMVFLNRRGYSTSLNCPNCGYVATCTRCDLPYTYHRADNCLRCHICGSWEKIPQKCPGCGDPDFKYSGIGTQRVEQILRRCFPGAKIARMDADSTSRKESHDDILAAFKAGRTEILVGTQMIAKGLDFPRVTLVGIVNADTSLHIPDFRAGERTFQLLAQVSGRTGRGIIPGEVFIQTFSPEHPAVQMARTENFEGFVETELPGRQALGYPPYTHLTCITVSGPDERLTQALAGKLRAAMPASAKDATRPAISEVCPAALAKADGIYRFQIVLRAASAVRATALVRAALAAVPVEAPFRATVDVDAFSF